jgi:hypothetical protein
MQVLTGDIIDSTKLYTNQREGIIATLSELEKDSNGQYDYLIRGDSFQILMEKGGLTEALKIKYLLKFRIKLSVRISIGIGSVTVLEKRLSNSDGPAFWLSGQGLDAMKEAGTLNTIHLQDEKQRDEWKIYGATMDYLEEQLTDNQAEVLYWLLNNKTQQEMAKEIGITQSSVNRRIKATGWPIIQLIIARFETVFDNKNIK